MASQTIVVVGASGATGLLFIKEALAANANVVAYVRTPSKIPADLSKRIRVVKGGLTDAAALDQALQGASILVSFLGPTGASFRALIKRDFSSPIADAFRDVIIPRAKANGVKRILVLGTVSHELPTEKGKVPFPLRASRTMLYYLVPTGYAEMHNIGEVINSIKGLEWVLFRVGFLYDEKPGKPVKAIDTGRFGEGYRGGTFLSRENIARWAIKEMLESKYSGQVVAIGELP